MRTSQLKGALKGALTTAVAATMLAANPAKAEWKRAESPRFVVYYQGSESALRRYVRNLEVYDFVLRRRMGLPQGEPAARKLPIYLVGSRSGLVQINPRTGENVAGTYFPVEEGVFASAIHDREQDFLLHEYFHHFSMEMPAVSNYPGWLIEGLAEYFMTAEIKNETVEIGHPNSNRVSWLLGSRWIDLEEMLRKRPGQISSEGGRNTYYPVAWLLTHWLMSDAARNAQLQSYVQAVQAGGDPVTSLESTTGMSLSDIRRALRGHLRAGLRVPGVRGTLPDPEITVASLPASADDLLLVGQRLKIGVAEDQRAATAALVRRLAARHPDDPFALLQLGHAELHFGDRNAGVEVLNRLLEREPNNVEALQLLATHHIHLMGRDPEHHAAHRSEARTLLRRAYEADGQDYRTLHLLAETRSGMPDYPTENDLTTWDLAHRLAPQLASITLGYGRALMLAREFDEAVIVLGPLANAPHGGEAAKTAATLLGRAKARQAPLGEEEIAAATKADEAAPREPEPEAEPTETGSEDEDQDDRAGAAGP